MKLLSSIHGRRAFLTKAGLWALAGHLIPSRLAPGLSARNATSLSTGETVFGRLKVQPVVNAVGTVTMLGGSIMPPEVVAAMEEAAKHFVSMPELLEKSGEYLARLIGVEAALVTTGAAGAITVGTAACVAGSDPQKIRQLPDTSGMKHEILMQKSHRCGYEPQMLLVGTRIIEIETRQELESAINDRTAMLFFLNKADSEGQIRREEWVAIGRKHRVPTFNDAAADVPPETHLSSYAKMGFDLVAFSGGKGLLGPQCSGLLLGRKDLVDAARLNASPWGGTIGRGMKVGKEEIVGLVAAVERYLTVDHEAEYRELESRVLHISKALAGLKGVRAELFVPEVANHLPHLAVAWEPALVPLASAQVAQRLREGQPRIEVLQREQNGLAISVWMMRPGQHKIVADRLREVLSGKT
jgi:L-seryl-tRNA(Ser) seleniumtransferase